MNSAKPQLPSQWLIGNLVDSRKKGLDRQKCVTLPIAIVIHAFVILSMVMVSMRAVTYISDTPVWVGMTSYYDSHGKDGSGKGNKLEQNKAAAVIEYAPASVPDTTERVIIPVIPVSNKPDVDADKREDAGKITARMLGAAKKDSLIDLAALLKLEPPKRIGVDAQGEQPKVILRVQPDYPEAALRAFLEGIVVLEAVVSKFGTVADVRILKSLNPILDQAAIKAVYKWKFEPGQINHVPMNAYVTVTVIFTINQYKGSRL